MTDAKFSTLQHPNSYGDGQQVDTANTDIYAYASQSLPNFIEVFLSDDKTVASPRFHTEISDLLLHAYHHFGIEAFRECGKSTLVMRAFPLYCLTFPDPQRAYIVIIQDNAERAAKTLRNIRDTFLSDPLLHHAALKVIQESEKVFEVQVVAGQAKVINVRIESYGKGSALRGLLWGSRRPQIVILDDVQDREAALSEAVQKKDWDWFNSDVKYLGKDTRIFIIGNNLGAKCLMERIDENKENLGFQFMRIPILNENNESVWPERFPTDFVLDEKEKAINANMLDSWYRERMCEAMSDNSRVFKEEYLQYYQELPPEDHIAKITMGVDLAIATKKENDYTVITVVARTKNNYDYVVHSQRMKASADAILDEIFKLHNLYNPHITGIENTGGQDFFVQQVEKEMRLRQKFFTLERIKASTKMSKEEKIISTLQPRFAQKNIFLHNSQSYLKEELLIFPMGKHDDTLDSLEIAVRLLQVQSNNQVTNYRKPTMPTRTNYQQQGLPPLRDLFDKE